MRMRERFSGRCIYKADGRAQMARVGLSSNFRGYSYLGIAPDLSGQHWKAAPHAARLSSSPHHATECHEMPLRFIELNNPQIPTWGETSLDLFLLSEWDKHHPDPYDSKESTTDRRRRLLRQFLALGCEGREVNPPLPSYKTTEIRLTGQNFSATHHKIHSLLPKRR